MADRNEMTSNDLRRLAEHADGFRNEPLYLEEYWDGTVLKLKVSHVPTVAAHVAVLTPNDGQSLHPIESVDLRVDGGEKHIYDVSKVNAPNDVDSLFWTQSAALKFLYPYYARFYSQEKLAELYAACTNSVAGKDIYAIGHRFPTIYEEYSDDRSKRSPAWIRNEVISVWAPTGSRNIATTTLGEMLDSP